MRPRLWNRLLPCLLTLACTPPPVPEPDTTPDIPADIGPCADVATLYTVSTMGSATLLETGAACAAETTCAALPVIKGFQGLIFVRIGLRSGVPLPPTIKMTVQIEVPGLGMDLIRPFPAIKTSKSPEGAYQGQDQMFAFSDATVIDLMGQPARVRVWTTSPGCRLAGEAHVVLSDGGFMGADAWPWQDGDTTN